MRLLHAYSLCLGIFLLLCGCVNRDSPPDKRSSANGQTSDDARPVNDRSDFAARLDAASTINDVSVKDDALAKLASDAATAGNDEIAKKSIDGIQNLSTRDDAAYSSALDLAKAGKGAAAVAIAKSMNNLTKQDEVLAKIAKGDSSK